MRNSPPTISRDDWRYYGTSRSSEDESASRDRRNSRRYLHHGWANHSGSEYESAVTLLRGLNELRKDGTFCDVVLRIGERTIRLHKNVITISSPYFMAMLSGDFLESQDEQEITIKDIEAEGLEILIEYMYTGKLNIDSANAKNLLSTASFLQITKAQELCYTFMEDDLNAENWLEYMLFAEKNSIQSLKDASLEKAVSEFFNIFPRNEYLELDFEEFKQLTQRLKENEHLQDLLYPFVMRWINYSNETRISFIDKLLRGLDPLLISPNLLFSSEIAITSNPVFTAWASRANSTRSKINWFRHKPREHILVSRRTDTFRPLRIKISSQAKHREIKTLPESITDGSYVCNGYYIYHQGGRYQEEIVHRSYAYHPIQGQWHQFIPLQEARAYHSSCVLNGRIYSVGGSDGFNALSSVEFLDLITGQRGLTEPLPRAKEQSGLGIHENSLYVIGGSDRGTAYKCIHRLDVREGVWQELSPSLHGWGASSCAVIGENIYTTHSDTLQRYDIRTNAWARISAEHKKYPQEVFAIDNKLFGLFNDHIAKFAPETGKWESKQTMNCNFSDLHVSTNLLFPNVNQMSPLIRNRFKGHHWTNPK